MTIFYLPDLGEGLAEAIIHEWFVNTEDEVKTDQLIASVETAKAIVDIPAPFSGKVLKLFASPGETLKVGAALIDICSEQTTATVAGKLETSSIVLEEENFDLEHSVFPAFETRIKTSLERWQQQAETLSGIRLSMSKNMQKAHQEVVPASIFDQADISCWDEKTDITAAVIQAVCTSCKEFPALNAWFDGYAQKRLLHDCVHLSLALNTSQGLLTPVIKHAEQKSRTELRQIIDQFKQDAGGLSPAFFQGGTITLSNIGKYAGLFATPIVLPPTTAIIAVGRIRRFDYAEPHNHKKLLPLSLSFDHRAVTGAEAAGFLQSLLKNLAITGVSK